MGKASTTYETGAPNGNSRVNISDRMLLHNEFKFTLSCQEYNKKTHENINLKNNNIFNKKN